MAYNKIVIKRLLSGFIINAYDEHNDSDYADDFDEQTGVTDKEDLQTYIKNSAFAPYSKKITKEPK